MRRWLFAAALLGLAAAFAPPAAAQVNQLTPEEKAQGWRLLFNGKDHTGWMCNNGKPVATPVEDGALVPYRSGGYLIVYKEQFGDFVLRCDVKQSSADCNSGIFFRIGDLKDPVQTGLEVQVWRPGNTVHSFGAIYDLVPPRPKNPNYWKPPGQWNTVEIRCQGPHIQVKVNGQVVAKMNCDEWTEPGRRPDGSKHKFRKAIKDFPRRGYIGFQDHGQKVWYRNVKLLELK